MQRPTTRAEAASEMGWRRVVDSPDRPLFMPFRLSQRQSECRIMFVLQCCAFEKRHNVAARVIRNEQEKSVGFTARFFFTKKKEAENQRLNLTPSYLKT